LGHSDHVQAVCLSGDAEFALTGSGDGSAVLWDAATGKQLRRFTIGKDGPFLIPVEDSRTAIPTVVFFRYDDNKILYGQAAIGEYVSGTEGRQMRSLKSILGTELMYEKTRLAKTSVAFADVIGAFIRQLKRQAETFLGDAVDSVVLGRPVHFVNNDAEGDARAQSELEAIARKQGFHRVEFQLEPIAAAMAYQTQVQRRAVALIIDAGGGTSDFSGRTAPDEARVLLAAPASWQVTACVSAGRISTPPSPDARSCRSWATSVR
jgi:hypothetical chaperone protein